MQSRERPLLSDSNSWNGSRFKRSIALFVVFVFSLTLFSLPSQQVTPVAAQSDSPVSLIKDINDKPWLPTIDDLTVANNIAFFTRTNQFYTQLWKTNGTETGTTLIKSISRTPSEASSGDENLLAVQNKVLLWVDGPNGTELWISNGSETGTYQLPPPPVGESSGNLRFIGSNDQSIFFSIRFVEDSSVKNSLLAYNNNSYAILAEYGNVSFGELPAVTIQGVTYFTASSVGNNGVVGTPQLWRTDGTAAGTYNLKALPRVLRMKAIQNRLVLLVVPEGESVVPEIWSSDGTPQGTQKLIFTPALPTGRVQTTFSPINSNLFFKINNELWSSDGTVAGSQRIIDSTPLQNLHLTTNGGDLYIGGIHSENGSWELWKKSASAPASLVAAVLGGNGASFSNLIALEGKVYFIASNQDNTNLWVSDGTRAGTVVLDEGPDAPLVVLSSQILYSSSSRKGLRVSKDTESSKKTIFTSTGDETGDFFFRDIVTFKNKLYLLGERDGKLELWQSDGTTAGTTLTPLVTSNVRPVAIDATDTYLFFKESSSGKSSTRIWRSDGTPAGTIELIADTKQVVFSSSTILNNKWIGFGVKHNAATQNSETHLWVSDGTIAGTSDLGVVDHHPYVFSQALPNGKQLFLSSVPADVAEFPRHLTLGETDGTLSGTKAIKQISDKFYYSSNLLVEGNKVYFVVVLSSGYELWTSDGTATGTQRVAALPPVAFGSLSDPFPVSISSLNGQLYFTGRDSSHGSELWTSDGTSAGTKLVLDIHPGAESGLASLTKAHDTLLLSATNGTSGFELWASDGTAQGTYQVADIAPGIYSSSPSNFTTANGFIAFMADNGVIGRELYKIAAPTAVTLQGSAVTSAGAGPQSQVAIPLSYGNNGVTKAVSVTLSLELPNGLSYVSDTLGVSPTITGNLIEWKLPDANYLSKRSAAVVLGTPDQPYGTRIPVNFSLKANGVTPLTIKSEVVISHQSYLPIVVR